MFNIVDFYARKHFNACVNEDLDFGYLCSFVANKNVTVGKNPKIVLYWNGQSFSKGQDFIYGIGCGNRCLFTTNRSLLPNADAILLHKNMKNTNVRLKHYLILNCLRRVYYNSNVYYVFIFVKFRKWPKRHNQRQLFVATRFEPPTKDGAQEQLFNTLNSSSARNYFNVTFSYRFKLALNILLSDLIFKYLCDT